MSLTKHDLQQIEHLFERQFEKHFEIHFSRHFGPHFSKHFVQAFEQYIVPYVDAKIDGLDVKIDGVDERLLRRMDKMEKQNNEYFLTLHEKIEENTLLIGSYFQNLDVRVQRLESKV